MVTRWNVLRRHREKNAARLARLGELQELDVKIGKIDRSLNIAWGHPSLKKSAPGLEARKSELKRKRASLKGASGV